MSGWLTDLRDAFRALRISRWTTVGAVATLALGTGANTAVVAVAYSVLLRPLPYRDASRLVIVSLQRTTDGEDIGVPLADFDEWRGRLTTVDGIAAYSRGDFTVRGGGDPEVLHAGVVTGQFFSVLGAPPARGSAPEDDRASSGVVISDRYARRLDTTGAAIGRRLSLAATAMDVAGVMPAAFAFPADDIDLWVPARSAPIVSFFDARDRRLFRMVARVKTGRTIADVNRDAARVLLEIAPGTKGQRASVRALPETVVGDVRPLLGAFVAAAILALVVACANVATLLVSRTLSREREYAIRLAVGADARRLIRAALAESLILAVAASLAGLWIAKLSLAALVPLGGASLPRSSAVALDLPVVLIGGALAVVVALACGLAPALTAARSQVASVLRRESGTTVSSGHRVRALLIVAQMATAVVLVTGAGLFARTVWHLWTTDFGADRAHVLSARLALTETTRFDASSRGRFVETLLARVRALPGVEAAGIGSNLPPRVNQIEMTVRFVDAGGRDETHGLNLVAATSGYFRALGIRLTRGREFTDAETSVPSGVAVVSEMLAHQLSPRREMPLDAQMALPLPAAGGTRVRPRVIGVAPNVRFLGLERPAEASVYVPWPQVPTGTSFLVVRSAGDPAALAPAIARVIRDLDPTLPLPVVRPLSDEISEALAPRTFRLWLVASLAVLAFVLSMVGLTSALVRSVTERQRELAVRVALGATPRHAAGLVLGDGARLIGFGLLAGGAASLAVGRLTATLLVGVSPYDPTTFAAVVVGVALVGLAGCYIPARRAAAVDPIVLLKGQ